MPRCYIYCDFLGCWEEVTSDLRKYYLALNSTQSFKYKLNFGSQLILADKHYKNILPDEDHLTLTIHFVCCQAFPAGSVIGWHVPMVTTYTNIQSRHICPWISCHRLMVSVLFEIGVLLPNYIMVSTRKCSFSNSLTRKKYLRNVWSALTNVLKSSRKNCVKPFSHVCPVQKGLNADSQICKHTNTHTHTQVMIKTIFFLEKELSKTLLSCLAHARRCGT